MATRGICQTSASDQRRVDGFIRELEQITNQPSKVAVGLPEDSLPYPDGTSTILVAIVNEFGSPENNIPERGFLRAGTAVATKKVKKLLRKGLARKVLRGEISAENSLSLIGQLAEDQVKKAIVDFTDPPNADSTLAAKAPKTSPLQNSGHLRQSVRHEVNPDEHD